MLSLNKAEKDYFLAIIYHDMVEFPDGDEILTEAQRNDLFAKVTEMETEEC